MRWNIEQKASTLTTLLDWEQNQRQDWELNAIMPKRPRLPNHQAYVREMGFQQTSESLLLLIAIHKKFRFT